FPYLANSYSEHFLAQRESQVLLSFNSCRLEGTAYRQAAGHGFLLETLELSFANVLAGDDFRRARPKYWPGFHRSRCFVRCWFLPLDLEEAHELLQLLGLGTHFLSGGRQLFRRGRILLSQLVELLHRRIDLPDPSRLL